MSNSILILEAMGRINGCSCIGQVPQDYLIAVIEKGNLLFSILLS
jgi:hypothetical protein